MEVFEQLNPGEPLLPNELLSREEMRGGRRTCCSPTTPCSSTCCSAPWTWTCSRASTPGTGGSSSSTRRTSTTGPRARSWRCCCAGSRDRVGRRRRPVQCIATSATVGGDIRGPWSTSPPTCSPLRSSGTHGRPGAAGPRHRRSGRSARPGPSGGRSARAGVRGTARRGRSRRRRRGTRPQARVRRGTTPPRRWRYEQRVRRLKAHARPRADTAARGRPGLFPGHGPADARARWSRWRNSVHDNGQNPGAVGPLPPVRPGDRGRLQPASEPRAARQPDPARAVRTAAARRLRVRHLPPVRRRPPEGTLERVGALTVFRSRRSLTSSRCGCCSVDGVAADEDEECSSDAARGRRAARRCAPAAGCFQVGAATSCPALPGQRHARRYVSCASAPTSSRRAWRAAAAADGLIRLFESGNEAAASVLATALYQELPAAPDPVQQGLPGGGRKLLFFSDSRQTAAYFAPYLEDSYERDRGTGGCFMRALRAAATRRREARRGGRGRPDRRGRDRFRHLRPPAESDRRGTAGRGLLGDSRKLSPSTNASPWKASGLMRLGHVPRPRLAAAPPLLALGLDRRRGLGAARRTAPQRCGCRARYDAGGGGPARRGVRTRGSARSTYAAPAPSQGRKVLSWLPTRGTNRRADYLAQGAGPARPSRPDRAATCSTACGDLLDQGGRRPTLAARRHRARHRARSPARLRT